MISMPAVPSGVPRSATVFLACVKTWSLVQNTIIISGARTSIPSTLASGLAGWWVGVWVGAGGCVGQKTPRFTFHIEFQFL